MSESHLRSARKLVGLTQADLDVKAGLPRGTTYDIESGRNERPAYDTVVRLVRALRRAGLTGASVESLFQVPDSAPGGDLSIDSEGMPRLGAAPRESAREETREAAGRR